MTSRAYSLEIPSQYREHVLIQNRTFLTLPPELLDAVLREVGAERFDVERIEMEMALSNICADHTTNVGFLRGQPIPHQLLRIWPMTFSDEFLEPYAAQIDVPLEDLRDQIAIGNDRLQWTVGIRRGYCGWLLTNPQFLKEHEELFDEWSDQILRHGVPGMGSVVRGTTTNRDFVSTATGSMQRFLVAFENFFVRWRLEGMGAPMVPRPLGPHVPVIDMRLVTGHMEHSGTTATSAA